MPEIQGDEQDTNGSSLKDRRVQIDRQKANELVITELAKLDHKLNQAGSMTMSRVPGDDEIYVSGIFALRRKSALEQTGITHIVSVLRYNFKDFEDWEKYQHLNIDVNDVEDENLLGELPRAVEFITKALEGGGRVLVHCAMGKSRSVTAVAAFLMSKYPELTPPLAVELIRGARPIAEPNEGFMAQLELFHAMKCPKNIEEEPKYQRWLYQRERDLSLAAGMAPDNIRFEDEEKRDAEEGGNELEYKCKKCRRTLATTTYLTPHVPKPPREQAPISSLAQLSSQDHNSAPSSTCGSLFLDPLSWMRPELSQGKLEGRLECPNEKCNANVGKYAWQGMRCSCGVWVIPAISLQKARVDETKKVVRKVGGMGIRMPPGAAVRGKENL